MTARPASDLITAQEAAAILGTSYDFVKRHSSGGQQPFLPHFKIGRLLRFKVEDVEAFRQRGYNNGALGKRRR